MGQASVKKVDKNIPAHFLRGLREGALLLAGAISLYLLAALVSYDPVDPGWSHSNSNVDVANLGGIAGAWFADLFFYVFGYLAYLFPILIAYSGWVLYRGGRGERQFDPRVFILMGTGFLVALCAGTGLASLHLQGVSPEMHLQGGGILGEVVGNALVKPFSFAGASLFLLAMFLAGISAFTGLSWFWLMDVTGAWVLKLYGQMKYRIAELYETWRSRPSRHERQAARQVKKEKIEKIKERIPPRIEPAVKKLEPSVRVEREKQVPMFESTADGQLPPLSLLDDPEPSTKGYSKEALAAMSQLVELKLKDFGIECQVVAVHPGPVITRFELQPAAGVKVSQISNLAKDLARALSAVSVRIVEVIPGKSVIGLEVPNEHREIVRLSEILKSSQYDEAESPLSLALGKDISGHPVVVDLARMPHLLVAGTTGSGKSMAVNAMVLSMLFNTTAREMRVIMIDPKMLELSVYEGIPHLLTPVVTDMKQAANALRWCVGEMERRYRLMAALGVRNIAGYNRKVTEAIEKKQPLRDPLFAPVEGLEAPQLQTLPYIVVIIDELADMMMVVGKKVEELIARLAQKARAAGIHLILATQRPSVDVLTGLIKANIPSRIAFQVSSRIDSRTILDQMGAEQLLGHGDMLYLAPGTGVPMRVHGAYVADQEVHKVVAHLKRHGGPDYLEEVLEVDSRETNGGDYTTSGYDDGEQDPLYDQALRIVTETRRASVSGIQRRLKIGYNRAARMIEQMETAGVVGPLQSNGNREVLAPPPVTLD